MKVLFLTLLNINSLDERNIYTDLLKEFEINGHEVTVISPIERRNWRKSNSINDKRILKVKIPNITKTNVVEKGISTLVIDKLYLRTIKKYIDSDSYDLIIYTTPPVTFEKTISYFKERKIKTYLLLKDIFPQNAIDLNLMKENSFLHKFFRNKEKNLYLNADFIGCMSPKNVSYILENNKKLLLENKIHVSPNSISPERYNKIDEKEIESIRKKYGIPLDKKIFIYGGNIGKPQGLPYFLRCLKKLKLENEDAFFVIVGSGTELVKSKNYARDNNLTNLLFLDGKPTEEFNIILSAVDAGLILLDKRFTIPNFPSRTLSYMQAGLPIIAATDNNSDIGKVITKNKIGYWVSSENEEDFVNIINEFTVTDSLELMKMCKNSYNFLTENYTSKHSYEIIINEIKKGENIDV